MEYIVFGLLALLILIPAIVTVSLYKSQLKVKNGLINSLTKVCIRMEADSELLAALTKRGEELDDEDVLIRVNSWLFTKTKREKQLLRNS